MSFSDTQKRIASAIVMLIILAVVFFLGGKTLEYFTVVIGLLLQDEIQVNLAKRTRFSKRYWASFVLYIVISYFVVKYGEDARLFPLFITSGLIINAFVLWFLFFPKRFIRTFSLIVNSFLINFVIALSVVSFWGTIYLLISSHHWLAYIFVIASMTAATDSFAWLVGKRIGKTPLWPDVSPKKTWEGAIGGFLGGGLILFILWYNLIDSEVTAYWYWILLLPIGAQIGDLAQSRIKRWVDIKDSSRLIPGHGGLFDRMDSLMFTAPFFLALIWIYT